MTRRFLFGWLALCGLVALFGWRPWEIRAQEAGEAQWIWFNEGDPLTEAPIATRYFRKSFTINRPVPKPVEEASLEITADNRYTVWINGHNVGSGDDWSRMDRYDVQKHLVNGKNVIAVEAGNDGGPAGLVVRLTYAPSARPKTVLVSDGTWKSAQSADEGWQKVDFNDGKWKAARALGALGKAGPWKPGIAGKGPAATPRFTVPAGFKVEQAVKKPADRGPFSLVNMTFDAKGRVLVSQENGPILLCTDPDKDGVMQTVRDYCTLVKNSQGMCWINDALYLVGNGPKGTGLYRCRDTKNADHIDEATLLHRFNGGMGEHGPHAILHGPDGWLYVAIGNHAWADLGPKKEPNPEKLAANSPLLRWPTGGMGPDQGKPGSTEDVLLPRLNDARGHAANILAPGGTIWRMDTQGKNVSQVSAGFRNHFDIAFSPAAELFTFDSDMEWDEALPWYRAVRICHCPPGADFVWRTGAANTPNYYVDSLPPLYETGRGSPVGLEFYDHVVYPKKYHGTYFMADWSLGIIYGVHLKRSGATYQAEVEKFCTGAPLNVTDLGVGPDGALYFTMGGRGTQGGVYRIVYPSSVPVPAPGSVQPLAAWSRAARAADLGAGKRAKTESELTAAAEDVKAPAADRVRALTLLHMDGLKLENATLTKLAGDKDADVRAHAVWLLGMRESKEAGETLLKALKDDDPLVRRRACEALIRAGIEPSAEAVWPLLNDEDRFVRTAARLVLQRIDPAKWVERLGKEERERVICQGVVALCKIDKAADHAGVIYSRLNKPLPAAAPELLDVLRTAELAAFHIPGSAEQEAVKELAGRCEKVFPHTDKFVNRELAILLTHYRRTGLLPAQVQAKLVAALEAAAGDQAQQIHYFYCMRLLQEGWTPEQKQALVKWYESTRDWKGGFSFTPFLENIFRELLGAYTVAERKVLLEAGDKYPQACLVLLQRLQTEPAGELLSALKSLSGLIEGDAKLPRGAELRRTLDELTLRIATSHPTDDAFPELVKGVSSPNKIVVFDALSALLKVKAKPKPMESLPFRAVILAAGRLDPGNRWKAVEVLRHWTDGREFGSDKGDWKPELESWTRWYGQSFPKEPALPSVGEEKPAESKYKFAELLDFLNKDGKTGDVKKGRIVFEKATCIKCHKYGKDGEGVGPDLSTVSKRFKRVDTLESIIYPSKVISDQYRSTTFETNKGQVITGLAAVQGDLITVLQSDGTKVTLSKKDVARQFVSLVSVMPERLLDTLTKPEIADLFAFLESEPDK
jgi:putative heme-binding domain-containing protein